MHWRPVASLQYHFQSQWNFADEWQDNGHAARLVPNLFSTCNCSKLDLVTVQWTGES